MLWLWILIVLTALFVLLCLLRLHLRADFQETASLILRIGPIPIQLLPHEAKESEQAEEKQKISSADGMWEKLRSIPRPAVSDLGDAWQTLGPVIRRALRRTRRGIRIDPLTLSMTLGGREDPAQTAEYYGYAHAVVWSLMPALEQLVAIPDPAIHIGMDFDADSVQFRGSIGVSIRIGTLILLGMGISIPALRWFLKYLKRKKASNNVHQQPACPPAA